MDIKQIEREVKEHLDNLSNFGRRTISEAIEIGKLLKEAKGLLPHGEFMPWCSQLGISSRSADRFLLVKAYQDKLANMANLQEAYTLIESEENKRKQKEFQEQSKRIHEYRATGNKPEGWDDKTDEYRLKKEKEDSEFEKRKIEMFEKRQKDFEKRKNEQERDRKKDDSEREKIISGLADLIDAGNEKQRLLDKMRLTGNNSKEPIYDALFEYLIGLGESQRLEACHNIIKFCKTIASELQKESIK